VGLRGGFKFADGYRSGFIAKRSIDITGKFKREKI
jgi:hypothetical protein